MVASVWYLYISAESIECYKGFIYMTIAWIVVELILIAYMFKFNNIPCFARNAISLIIAFSNIWFGLLVFSLKPCGT